MMPLRDPQPGDRIHYFDRDRIHYFDHTRGGAPAATPIPEGSECPTCLRRVPKAKKPTSPKSKVVSIRVPIDDAERFQELLEACAKHDGQYEKPHWQYWTVLRGLVRTLQEPPDGS